MWFKINLTLFKAHNEFVWKYFKASYLVRMWWRCSNSEMGARFGQTFETKQIIFSNRLISHILWLWLFCDSIIFLQKVTNMVLNLESRNTRIRSVSLILISNESFVLGWYLNPLPNSKQYHTKLDSKKTCHFCQRPHIKFQPMEIVNFCTQVCYNTPY